MAFIASALLIFLGSFWANATFASKAARAMPCNRSFMGIFP
jgi:hypothetical protein